MVNIPYRTHIEFDEEALPLWAIQTWEDRGVARRIIPNMEEKLVFLQKCWKEWTTEELCNALHMSPTQLNALFVPVFGPKVPLRTRWAERLRVAIGLEESEEELAVEEPVIIEQREI